MRKPMSFPVRLKFLITLLMVVAVVGSVITFAMANIVHEDKKSYVSDLVSRTAEGTASGCNSVLASYKDRLRIYGRIMAQDDLSVWKKEDLLKGFFADFGQLVAVVLYQDDEEVSAVYDRAVLEEAGLTKADLVAERAKHPLPLAEIAAGRILVENSTVSDKLPIMTLTVPYESGPGETNGTPIIVSAVIRLEELIRATKHPGPYDIYLVDSNGVLLASRRPEQIAAHEVVRSSDELRLVQSEHAVSIATERERDGKKVICAQADAQFGGITVMAEIQKSAIYVRQQNKTLMFVAITLLMGAAVTSVLASRRITRPVERLAAAARDIGKGKFEIQVDVNSRDEIGSLALSFNQMAFELREREEALEGAHRQLVQSEKMAAFGQLGAGIAHEVKNPLAGILGCAQLSLRKAEPGSPLQRNLQLIEKETKRCKTIVENLLRFARQEKAVQEPIEVNAVIQDAVSIVNHQLEINQVKLSLDLADDLPKIRGNANQLQQVVMNLLINAQQALEGKPGSVEITTGQTTPAEGVGEGKVEVRVADSGPGIPPEIQGRIFDPFFTTKPNGKGTGLGLSVSFGIVKDHQGEITVRSDPGKGATFVILLPAWRADQREEEANSAQISREGMAGGEGLANAA